MTPDQLPAALEDAATKAGLLGEFYEDDPDTFADLRALLRESAAYIRKLEAELDRVTPYLAAHGAMGYRLEVDDVT